MRALGFVLCHLCETGSSGSSSSKRSTPAMIMSVSASPPILIKAIIEHKYWLFRWASKDKEYKLNASKLTLVIFFFKQLPMLSPECKACFLFSCTHALSIRPIISVNSKGYTSPAQDPSSSKIKNRLRLRYTNILIPLSVQVYYR